MYVEYIFPESAGGGTIVAEDTSDVPVVGDLLSIRDGRRRFIVVHREWIVDEIGAVSAIVYTTENTK